MVPSALGFMTRGWNCDKTLIEKQVGQLPDPLPYLPPDEPEKKNPPPDDISGSLPQSYSNDLVSGDCNTFWTSHRVCNTTHPNPFSSIY